MLCRYERTIFKSDKGFCIFSYSTEDQSVPKEAHNRSFYHDDKIHFTAIGYHLVASNAVEVELDGTWENSKHGLQLSVSMCKEIVPTNQAGILAYLSSGVIKGVGPEIAKAIVARFGDKTMEVLDKEPQKLLSIKGIAQRKLKAIIASYEETKALSDLMIYLAPFGVSMKKAAMIKEEFGDNSLKIVKSDPFQLCKVIVFCDDGVTGTHFDRPKFDELIEMARNQEIHCIMVKDLSRFGRNFLEMGNYLELILPLYGVRFISINDAFDSDDYLGVTGGLELALRNLINNMYSRDLSTKVRSAFRTRNLRGEYWGGNGFYGYQVHPHNKKRLIVDEQVRDIIVMIFESCVAGMTTSEIAQMLNDMGIPSPLEHKRRNGGFYNGVVKEETGIWLKGAVRKILTDERYTGKMITNTRETEEVGKPKMRSLPRDQWIIVPGTHEAIISEELFRTAQNALQGRIRNVNKNTAGNRANNLFVCGCCGRKLRKNPAKEPHLVCPKNDSIKGAECAGLFVNQAQIEQAVLQMLREQSRIFLEQHCLMQACIDKKLSSIRTELDANTNMTRRLQSRKAELYEQYRAGRISREKFADIQKTDSEKLARLSSRAEEIKRLLVEHYEYRGNLAARKRTADQIILLKDYDPEIIRNFVERVRVYPSGEIEIDMRTSSGFEFVTAS